MSKHNSKTSGLFKRGEIWWISKRVKGAPSGRLQESTGTSNYEEAERYLIHRLEQIRLSTVYGDRPKRTFREAATKWLLTNKEHHSFDQYAYHLELLDPFIGDLELEQVHEGTLEKFIEFRKTQGCKSRTIAASLEKVRRILNLCARKWRDDISGLTWLASAPLIEMPNWKDAKEVQPLDWDEQDRLFSELPPYLERMALFKVNTGLREREICSLRWDWEIPVPEIDSSVFLIPGEHIKNSEDRLVVLNKTARDVIDSVRGIHSEFVFTYFHPGVSQMNGKKLTLPSQRGIFCPIHDDRSVRPMKKMNNSSWKRAVARVGLDCGVHALKHTFGRRLRAAGVNNETRKVLLGHKNGDITTHYSAAELKELLDASEKVCGQQGAYPTLTVLKRRASNRSVVKTDYNLTTAGSSKIKTGRHAHT